ncbi:MAG: 2-oxo acid dehydrogenase subunit E2 [Lachnospiraceae bacterium]|nr:2-oxo acid dehydrogenase subunit E2 [Lachnospiraceae bacterium]
MKAKRRWGDRRDGTKLRDIDAMHYVMPLMYPNRCDNEAYMTISIRLDKTEEYLRRKNKESAETKVTLFEVIIIAILKTIQLRPQLNRFIANKTMYQRNNLTAAFTVKKVFSDEGDETLARIYADENDTLDSLAAKINEQITLCKTGTDESTDAMNVIKKLPFRQLIGAIARMLDRHGLMPKSVIATDPYQCSVVLTNLGSLGMNIGYHHLMNWGTTSLFVVVGKKHNKPHYDSEGNVTMKRELAISFTIDERISDGYYYARSLKLLKKLVENPELLEGPIGNEVRY